MSNSTAAYFFIFGLWFITNNHVNVTEERLLAAIEDHGCNSHLVIPEPKNLENKDTYKEW